MINEHPVTASEIAVLLFYPDAKHETWKDENGSYEVVITGNTMRGWGSTKAEAWQRAADVIEKKMILQ